MHDVISQKDYEALIAPSISLVDFFRSSPLVGLQIVMSREKSKNRDVDCEICKGIEKNNDSKHSFYE